MLWMVFAGSTYLIIGRNGLLFLLYSFYIKGVKKYDCLDIQLYLCYCIAVIAQKAASKRYSNNVWCLILFESLLHYCKHFIQKRA